MSNIINNKIQLPSFVRPTLSPSSSPEYVSHNNNNNGLNVQQNIQQNVIRSEFRLKKRKQPMGSPNKIISKKRTEQNSILKWSKSNCLGKV